MMYKNYDDPHVVFTMNTGYNDRNEMYNEH